MGDVTTGRDGPARRLAACSAVLWLAVAANAAAAAERDLDAHVHGVTKLNVAIEGKSVQMELIAPGADIVGFEHAPKSSQDKAAVAAAAKTLEDGAGLFVFPPEAGCQLVAAEIESGLLEDDHAEDDHAEEKHGKEDDHAAEHGAAEHAEEKHAEEEHGEEEHAEEKHAEEHEAHGEEKEAHAEFHAQYRFSCARPDRLSHVDVRFFERFPSGRELEVQAISPRGQSAQELTASAMRLKF